jgi:hypothetical protein
LLLRRRRRRHGLEMITMMIGFFFSMCFLRLILI